MSQVALKRVCELVTDPGPDEERSFVALEHVVGGTGSLQNNVVLQRRVPAAGIAAVEPGDVLFGKLRPYLAKTFRVSEPMFASTELMALRPTPNTDSRWLHYLLMSDQIIGWAIATSDGSKMPRTNWSELGEYRVTAPEPRSQRAIADFLDAETARIDALIDKKRRLAALVEDRFSRVVEVEVERLVEKHGTIPLKRLTSVTVGIVIQPARWYVEEGGVAALRGINIRPGRLELDDLVRISDEGHRANAKSRLHEGDLVVVRTGDAGAAVVVPPSFDGANCIDLLVVRRSSDLDSEFLRFVMNSGWAKKQITRGSVGTIQSHFNVESLRELPVPFAPASVQQHLRQHLDTESARISQIISQLRYQTTLLAEHRQALITAAVTGRIEVPGAGAW